MISTEFLQGFAELRSNMFEYLDTQNKERGAVPMKYMIALFRDASVKKGSSVYIIDYFIDEWSSLHPEAFDDSNR